jgi:CBS-domain-containing membrane protein
MMQIFDSAFKRNPRPYLVQSLLALLFAAVILFFVESVTHAAIVAALGSSTFIVFATPGARIAGTRELIGGHAVGVGVGAVCHFGILRGAFGAVADTSDIVIWVAGAVAIGLSVLLMTVTDTEHPPAAATALGIAIHGWSVATVVFVMAFAICLAIVRKILGSRLVDLY